MKNLDKEKFNIQITPNDIRTMIESSIDGKITKIFSKLEDIEKILIGNPSMNEVGMKREHDEMYAEYLRCRDFKLRDKVETLWDTFNNLSFLQKVFGITNIGTAIAVIISLLKGFGII